MLLHGVRRIRFPPVFLSVCPKVETTFLRARPVPFARRAMVSDELDAKVSRQQPAAAPAAPAASRSIIARPYLDTTNWSINTPFGLNQIIFVSRIRFSNSILNISNGTLFERKRRHPCAEPPNPLGNPLSPGPSRIDPGRARGPAGDLRPVRFLHLTLSVWHAKIEHQLCVIY